MMKKIEKIVIASSKPEESGETAEENAEIKGNFYAKKAGLIAFSEDEALYVDFLAKSEQPGVHVRRIGGKDEVDDEVLLTYWEKLIAKIPEEKRIGRWHTAYCIATSDGITKTIALDHPIIFFSPSSEVRIPGWPMSSLQGPAAFKKPDSELTEEERKIKEERTYRHVSEKLRELMEELK